MSDLIDRLIHEANTFTIGNVTAIEALEFRRDQYDLTQAEFAKVLKMQSSHYSEFINGKRGLPKHAMRRAVAVGVPAENVLAV